jgi:SGNH domain (fused to AT3 domains)
MAMAERRGIAPDMIGVTRTDALDEYRKVEAEIRTLERDGLVETVDPKTVLCPGAACAFESHGELLYRDTNHLSVTGAQLVAPAIEPCFAKISEGFR